MTSMLSLSDDVLLLIFSLLLGPEALPVCLTCKRVYRLAIARVASFAACQSPAQLRRLCDYYLSSDPFTGATRATYVEVLNIHATTFQEEGNGAEPAPVHLVGDLLARAHNIRRLALDWSHPAVQAEPRIPLAFSSMHRLTQIRFSKVADSTLNALQHIGNPKRLTLAYLVYDDELCDGGQSIPPLLIALAGFPNLHTLMLWNFTPWDLDDAPAFPPLPSVRYLLLSRASPFAINIVEHCPNLSTLVFSGDFDIDDDISSDGPRWRPLRHVILAEDRDGVCVVDRLSTVSLFQVGGSLDVVSKSGVSFFFKLLRLASPVGLYFGLRVYRCQWALTSTFWKDFPSVVHALRSLELKLEWSISWSGEDYDRMIRQLLDMLGSIPLLVLKLLVPPTRVPLRVICSRKSKSAHYKEELAKAKAQEKQRVPAVALLPRPLVDAIPTLRYLSVADMAPNPALTDDTSGGLPSAASHSSLDASANRSDASDSDDDSDNGTPDGWDDLREIGPIGKQMWWKIVEEDGQRVMVEISEVEGERVKREVELQDDEAMLRIEEAVQA